MQISGVHHFLNIHHDKFYIFMEDIMIDSNIDSTLDKHHQVVLSIGRLETYNILNQILPSFFPNKICNGFATSSILTSHYA